MNPCLWRNLRQAPQADEAFQLADVHFSSDWQSACWDHPLRKDAASPFFMFPMKPNRMK
jgi:hypothetical protein